MVYNADIDVDGFIDAERLSLYNNAEMAPKNNVDRFMELIKRIKYNRKNTSLDLKNKYDRCMNKIFKLSKKKGYDSIINQEIDKLFKKIYYNDKYFWLNNTNTFKKINKEKEKEKEKDGTLPSMATHGIRGIHGGEPKMETNSILRELKSKKTTLKKVLNKEGLVHEKIDILQGLLQDPSINDSNKKYDEELLKQLIDLLKHVNEEGKDGNLNEVFKDNNEYIDESKKLFNYINSSKNYDNSNKAKIDEINKLLDKLEGNVGFTHTSLDGLRDAYYNAKYSEYMDGIEINREDIIIFVLVTFLIRMGSLFMLKWMIDINMITSLEDALLAFAGFYILLFLLLLTLVNVQTTDITSTKSYLYFFYMKGSDNHTRLIVHAIVFGLLIMIPFIISEEERKKYMYETADPIEKRGIYKTITSFSLLMWILLSIVSFILV